ncbi:hypothetical protein M3Y94_01138300 [Aphelenchoides besseyi]|nr:hypothetical protein M3Y94_01138300 [Aphelenchoides besseyi]
MISPQTRLNSSSIDCAFSLSKMFKSVVLVLALLVAFIDCACVDGKNNVVKLADASSNNVIKVDNGVAQAYDTNMKTSCYKNEANIQLPGYLKLISGTINIGKQLKVINNNKALLTLRKNSWMVGYVCEDGKSKNFLVPDSDCNIDICTLSKALCKTLEIPGIHNLSEIEGDVGSNGTIVLPNPSSMLKPLLKGQWTMQIKLQVENEIVMHIKLPSNEDWLYLDE